MGGLGSALKLSAFAAVPAAFLAFVLSAFAWLVFRPIFAPKDSGPDWFQNGESRPIPYRPAELSVSIQADISGRRAA